MSSHRHRFPLVNGGVMVAAGVDIVLVVAGVDKYSRRHRLLADSRGVF